MYLLDTNVVSELRRRRPHRGVLAWLEATDDSDLNISAVTIGEVQRGIEHLRGRDDARVRELEDWLLAVEASYNVLPMDAACFRIYAKFIHARTPDLATDAMIAATAKTRELIVATRNTKDFDKLGVKTFNPFVEPRS